LQVWAKLNCDIQLNQEMCFVRWPISAHKRTKNCAKIEQIIKELKNIYIIQHFLV